MSKRSFDRDELAAAVRAAGIGVWSWDAATGAVRWSEATEELFGIPSGSFAGTFEAMLEATHEDDRALVEAEIRGAWAARSDFVVEHRAVPREGLVRSLECHGRVVCDDSGEPVGMTGACVDVTARAEAESALRESAERFRIYTELASDYVYEVPAGKAAPRILAGSFERITGYTPADVEARGGWAGVVHPEDVESTVGSATRSHPGGPYLFEYRVVAKDGRIVWLRDRGRCELDPSTGRPARFVGGVQDITELKELEHRLLQSQRMEALAHLSGRVAHDFNNLLTVVLGALGMIDRRSDDPRTGRYIAAAQEALDRAIELTRSLLTFGRHEVSTAEVVDIAAELRAMSPLLESAAGEGTRLELELGPRVAEGAPVLVDPGQLRLAIMNLVINARDAMQGQGKIAIRVEVDDLGPESPERPADLPPGPAAFISVIDRGPGIEPEHLARIFEPYFTTKPSGRGTGLGLSISYGVAHKYGGTISVASEVGVGTTFTMWFPLSASPVSTRAAPPPRPVIRGSEKILVVEDDAAVRAMVEQILEEHGYRVRSMSSAEDTLAVPDDELAVHGLLVSDVRLGGMDGVALAAELTARCPGLRVLLISGYTDASRHADIERHGFRFVPKPFTPTALVTAVREALEARSSGREDERPLGR